MHNRETSCPLKLITLAYFPTLTIAFCHSRSYTLHHFRKDMTSKVWLWCNRQTWHAMSGL